MNDDNDDNKPITKVWIYKYALTKGIYEIEARIVHDGKYASTIGLVRGGTLFREYALTRELAVEAANEMRDRKVKSLEKQLKKLKGMKF